MAVYRFIQTCFWEDSKVLDEMNYVDRYFYLYLLTNPHVNQCGCYEISVRQMINESGLDRADILQMLKKFEHDLKLIKIDYETKEILVINFYKYNWTKSPKVRSCVMGEITKIKSKKLMNFLQESFEKKYPMDSLSIDSGEKEKEKEKEKDKDMLSSKLDDTPSIFHQVVACFNKVGIVEDYFKKNKQQFHFKETEKTNQLIQKLLDQGYTKEDIFDVIFLKYDQWIEHKDDNQIDMTQYYRPSTVLGDKFDEYYAEAKAIGIS